MINGLGPVAAPGSDSRESWPPLGLRLGAASGPARAELAALRRHFADAANSSTVRRNRPPAVV